MYKNKRYLFRGYGTITVLYSKSPLDWLPIAGLPIAELWIQDKLQLFATDKIQGSRKPLHLIKWSSKDECR